MIVPVIEIRKALQSLLSGVHNEIHYEEAPDNTDYPYVVYNLPDSTDGSSLEQLVLEVDIWDTPINNNTVPLETLTGEIDNALHRFKFKTTGVFFSVYRENRRNVTDPNPHIKRRQLEYQIRLMGVNI